jgi:hypothetical protein
VAVKKSARKFKGVRREKSQSHCLSSRETGDNMSDYVAASRSGGMNQAVVVPNDQWLFFAMGDAPRREAIPVVASRPRDGAQSPTLWVVT